MCASRAAALTVSHDADGSDKAILSLIEALNRKVSWLTNPIFRRQAASSKSLMSTPSAAMLPLCGENNRMMRSAIVDLPAPDAPTRAVTSPTRNERDTSWRTGAFNRVGYAKDTCLKVSANIFLLGI